MVETRDLCGGTWSRKVRFTATDASGNSSSTVAIFRTIDTTAPQLAWSTSGKAITGSSLTVKNSGLPLAITVDISDICDRSPTLALSWSAAYTSISGRTYDVTSSTSARIRGNSFYLYDVPRSNTDVTVRARGTDACGNTVTETLVISVNNATTPISWGGSSPPGNGSAKGRNR